MAIGGDLLAHGKAKSAEFRAVVTRADGSVEDMGVIAYWHKNPLKRWAWNLKKLIEGIR